MGLVDPSLPTSSGLPSGVTTVEAVIAAGAPPTQADDKIYSFTMRMYFPDTMNRLLIDSGFTIKKMIGSHDFSDFQEDSKLQIYLCTQ